MILFPYSAILVLFTNKFIVQKFSFSALYLYSV